MVARSDQDEHTQNMWTRRKWCGAYEGDLVMGCAELWWIVNGKWRWHDGSVPFLVCRPMERTPRPFIQVWGIVLGVSEPLLCLGLNFPLINPLMRPKKVFILWCAGRHCVIAQACDHKYLVHFSTHLHQVIYILRNVALATQTQRGPHHHCLLLIRLYILYAYSH